MRALHADLYIPLPRFLPIGEEIKKKAVLVAHDLQFTIQNLNSTTLIDDARSTGDILKENKTADTKLGVMGYMEESLQQLLDAETRAQEIHRKAEETRERIIQEALQEAKAKEEQFESRLPELHQSFMEKAETRAEQTIAELKKRFNERHAQLREYAEVREQDALDAAFAVLIDPKADED